MSWFDWWRPRSQQATATTTQAANQGENLKPRQAHYAFAHYALREIAFARPLTFFGALASDEAPAFLAAVFQLVAEDCADQGETPDFTPADLQVHTGRIMNRPLALVQMPPPRAITEAYYVGAVMLVDIEQGEPPPNPDVRYFTLELALGGGAVLCEWTTDSHTLIGDCAATRDDFVRGIMEAL